MNKRKTYECPKCGRRVELDELATDPVLAWHLDSVDDNGFPLGKSIQCSGSHIHIREVASDHKR